MIPLKFCKILADNISVQRKDARETGLEPATSDVTGRCSNQLNYSRIKNMGATGLEPMTTCV